MANRQADMAGIIREAKDFAKSYVKIHGNPGVIPVETCQSLREKANKRKRNEDDNGGRFQKQSNGMLMYLFMSNVTNL